MKTHELARLLRQLADFLDSGINIEITRARVSDSNSVRESSSGLAVNLSTLAELSRIDKSQWVSLIDELGIRIPIRPRDASRDILGKLLVYLEQNEDARNKLKNRVSRKGEIASPDLTRALASLLGEK